jgi:hypothetical protein
LNETDTVAIGVLYIHFSGAPGLVNRSSVNADILGDEFGVESVHVVNDEVGHTTGNAIPGKRRDVQPDTIARQAHVTGIWFGVVEAMGEFPPEAEAEAIEVLRCSRVRDMEERDRELEQVAPHSGR